MNCTVANVWSSCVLDDAILSAFNCHPTWPLHNSDPNMDTYFIQLLKIFLSLKASCNPYCFSMSFTRLVNICLWYLDLFL